MADGDPFDIESIYPGYTNQTFKIESGYPHPSSYTAVTGSNRGLGQWSPDLERKYGITDANRTDYGAQKSALNQEAAEHYQMLTKTLGRPPTPSQLYLTHQQGVGGGPALLTADPNQPAWMAIRPHYGSDRMAQLAIGGNVPAGSPLSYVPSRDITAGDFRDMWSAKFNGTPMSPGPVSRYTGLARPTDWGPPPDGDTEAAAATSAQTGAGSSNPLVNMAMNALKQQPMAPAPQMNLLSGPRGNPYLQQLLAAMQQQNQQNPQT